MDGQIVEIDAAGWISDGVDRRWIAALEAGKVLYFPHLAFMPDDEERRLLRPESLAQPSRSITLEPNGRLKGVAGDEAGRTAMMRMMQRFRRHAEELVVSLLPAYAPGLRFAATSYRPLQVETRVQNWRADDKRLHVDAFAGRPNHGERILRVFANINQQGVPRTWRVGEPFEDAARRFLPQLGRYSRLEAYWLRAQFKTKKVRSEYDHIMLQLHDRMKLDLDYQRSAPQQVMPFPAGSVWVCYSDQTVHAAMAGQHMIEQTLRLAPEYQYDPESSPLATLTRLAGHRLV